MAIRIAIFDRRRYCTRSAGRVVGDSAAPCFHDLQYQLARDTPSAISKAVQTRPGISARVSMVPAVNRDTTVVACRGAYLLPACLRIAASTSAVVLGRPAADGAGAAGALTSGAGAGSGLATGAAGAAALGSGAGAAAGALPAALAAAC